MSSQILRLPSHFFRNDIFLQTQVIPSWKETQGVSWLEFCISVYPIILIVRYILVFVIIFFRYVVIIALKMEGKGRIHCAGNVFFLLCI